MENGCCEGALCPCHFCGSKGVCEHLVRVVEVDGRPVPVRAELGAEWGRRQIARLAVELAGLIVGG